MKTIQVLVLLLVAAFCMTGCLYTHIKTPFDTDADNTRLGDRQGESSVYGVLWLVAWGDSSTQAAAEQGDLAVVTHMDQKVLSILFGLYLKETTVVYGYGPEALEEGTSE